ncbi:uncharacterized protein ACMZJ9_019434 [Mantella aurantiaca]
MGAECKTDGQLFNQMPGPSDEVFNADEEYSSTDDHLYDTSEGWVADRRCYFENLDEDDCDLHMDTIPLQPHPSLPYEPEEDWDAEILEHENPYDEEDLVDVPCGEHTAPIDDTLHGDGSFIPSLHHATSIKFTEAHNVLNLNFEAGQFEDADL